MPEVVALGAWLKNAACRVGAGGVRWSALHGDLGDPAACAALEASVGELLAGPPVDAFAHDLHPDFFSTQFAQRLAAERGVPAIGVQHHHAHIAAVMAEHGVQVPVIGLALDGVGLGTDGLAWGGELLRVDAGGWKRLGHLRPLALPGGDVAAREPWRMAAALLLSLGRANEIAERFAPAVGEPLARGVARMLSQGLNCPVTTSAGRWFDAAAGALGLSVRQSHEAEAAIALERAAAGAATVRTLPQPQIAADGTLDLAPTVAALFDTPREQVGPSAAAFHLAFADALVRWAADACERTGARTVCLGGGCFLNAVLRTRVERGLAALSLRVLRPQAHSCGDAGLALGQAWVAAHSLG